MRRLLIVPVVFALALAAACGGGDGASDAVFNMIPGNSELAVGPNRFAAGLIDEDNRILLEEAGTSVHFRFLQGGAPKFEDDATFVWAIPDVNGFWTANVDFDAEGEWTVEAAVTRDGDEAALDPYTFTVLAQSQFPNVGDPAPPSENLTLGTEPNVKRISTDAEPEPALYELTVAQALEAGKPLVVTFATPAYCQTRFCGPMVDNVKEVRAEFADSVNFIHIEPFVLDEEGRLVPGTQGGPAVTEPMQQWRLQTEPWTFVIDAGGVITARFEGAASANELRQAIGEVAG